MHNISEMLHLSPGHSHENDKIENPLLFMVLTLVHYSELVTLDLLLSAAQGAIKFDDCRDLFICILSLGGLCLKE